MIYLIGVLAGILLAFLLVRQLTKYFFARKVADRAWEVLGVLLKAQKRGKKGLLSVSQIEQQLGLGMSGTVVQSLKFLQKAGYVTSTEPFSIVTASTDQSRFAITRDGKVALAAYLETHKLPERKARPMSMPAVEMTTSDTAGIKGFWVRYEIALDMASQKRLYTWALLTPCLGAVMSIFLWVLMSVQGNWAGGVLLGLLGCGASLLVILGRLRYVVNPILARRPG